MGGRGRRIGGGIAQYNPNAIQSFSGAGGAAGGAINNLLGLSGFKRPTGADPRELVNVGSLNTRVANPAKPAKATVKKRKKKK